MPKPEQNSLYLEYFQWKQQKNPLYSSAFQK